jgi:MFS family permease
VLGIVALGGLSVSHHLSRTIGLFLGMAAVAMVLFALLQSRGPTLQLLALAIGVLLQGGFVGLYAVSAKAYPTTARSTGIGWAIGVGRAGAVVGPLLVGYLVGFGLDLVGVSLLFSLPLVLGCFYAFRLDVR